MAAKLFEVGDVLPRTTQLRIHFNTNSLSPSDAEIKSNNDLYQIFLHDTSRGSYDYIVLNSSPIVDIYNYEGLRWVYPFTNPSGGHNYIDIDISNWPLEKRTISSVGSSPFTWEAKGTILPEGYTITFDSNGGSIVPQTSNATQLPDPLPITTKPGYTFVAWYIDSALTTRAVAGATIEEDTTLYAKWHNLGSLFTEIANAIREKESSSGTIRDLDFGERVKQIQGAKEEQQKIVTSSTSTQDVLPDSGKVLSRVTVNAIPTETKTVTPNFSSGNVVVTPTSGKVITQVTINKDSNLIAGNIKKDITVHGITGTLESGGGGYTVTFTNNSFGAYPSYNNGTIHYSFDNGVTYHPIYYIRSFITDSYEIVPVKLMGVTQIRFKIVATGVYNLWASVGNVLSPKRQSGDWSAESSNITLSSDVTYALEWWED